MRNSPFRLCIFPKAVSDTIHLLPALSPLVRVAFFRAHVDDFEIVAPIPGVLSFIPHTISLDGPFAGTFPFHYTTSYVGGEDDDELLTTPAPACSPVVVAESFTTD